MTFGDVLEILEAGVKGLGAVAVYLLVVALGGMSIIALLVSMVSTGGTYPTG